MKPTIGRIVHFVQPDKYDAGKQKMLPAMIVAVWNDTCVNLQVFTDGTNSEPCEHDGVKWVTSSTLDASDAPQPRTWHWPPKV
ncbi:MAG: hypothetical protein LAP40_16840 [Acidobacteriia bacterium]|nr:hypothetical protein [Terriglobia bacterium]